MRRAILTAMGVFSGAAGLLAPVTVARAADQSATAGAAAGLEEIIVTAEKIVENAQKTPISITTISGADIQKHAENQIDQMLRNVPALQIEQTPQGGAVYVRGVGMNGDSNFVDPSVALSLDGVYSARSERLSAPLYDVARAEVLRGPQGTIYGRNADGGAINIVSNSPVIGKDQAQVNLQAGNYALKHADASVNISAADNLAFRFAALREKRNGYFTNDGYSSDVTGGRARMLYQPTDGWTLLATLDYSRQKGDSTTTVPAPGDPLPFGFAPPFVPLLPNGNWPMDPNNAWFVDKFHPADIIDYKFVTSSVQSDLNLGFGTLTVIPTWTTSSRDVASNLVVGNFFGPISNVNNRETQKTAEVRLSSPASSTTKWVVGYYYLWSNNGGAGSSGPVASNLVDANGVTLYTTDNAGASPTVSKAPFAQVTYPLTDAWRVTGGVRYTQDTKSQASRTVSVAIPGYDSGLLVYNADFSATTYKVGVEYDVAPASMLYAQVSTGYKAGGFDTTANPPKSYKPERVRSYEIGSKNRFLEDTLQLNASVYYYDYSDLQVQYSFGNGPLPIPAAYIPAGNFSNFTQFIANADTGVNKGAEVELDYRLTANDEIRASGVYTDAHYGNFNKLTDPFMTQDANGNITLNGAVMAFTPKSTLTLDYSHDWHLGTGTLTAQADMKWSASYEGSVNNRGFRPSAHQDSYTRSDASLVYDSNKVWSVSAWVKNIENKAQVQFGDFPLNRNVISFPRTAGLNVSLKF